MDFVEFLNILLPILLYITGVILLIILIIIGLKFIRTMNKVEGIVDDVDNKVKSLNGLFKVIDITTDKLSIFTDKGVDLITNILKTIFKKKKRKEKENEEE
jgi:hypothetical protein